MKLAPQDAARLQRLLPLLASPHDGEVIATRNAIGRLLEAAGSDWHELACACVGYVATRAIPGSGGPSVFDMARACRALDQGRLTPKERGFVYDLCRRGFAFRLSPRQAQWLADIHERLQGRAAA